MSLFSEELPLRYKESVFTCPVAMGAPLFIKDNRVSTFRSGGSGYLKQNSIAVEELINVGEVSTERKREMLNLGLKLAF